MQASSLTVGRQSMDSRGTPCQGLENFGSGISFFLLQTATRNGRQHLLKSLRDHSRKARQFYDSEEWSLVTSLGLGDSPCAIRSRQVAYTEAVLAQNARCVVGTLAALAI
jgi:hypothetical protein